MEHESIVNFLDVKMSPSSIFIVQELMDTDLDCVFDNCPLGVGKEHTRLFAFQLIRAVNFLHSARVIHRDINPSNIFVNVDTLMLKVTHVLLSASCTTDTLCSSVISAPRAYWTIVSELAAFRFQAFLAFITRRKSCPVTEFTASGRRPRMPNGATV